MGRLDDSIGRMSLKRAGLARGFVSRAFAVLVVMCMLSTLVPGPEVNELGAGTSAAPGPFSPPISINDDATRNDQANPIVVNTRNHGLFAVWQDMRSGDWDIYTSRSIDNGSTWTPNKRADDSNGISEQIRPAVAVTGNGTILLAWQDARRSPWDYDVFFTKSYDGGSTFTRNVKVDDSNVTISWQERPSIAVTNSGAIYVAWTDDRTGYLRARGTVSTDGGATFSASQEIVTGGGSSTQNVVTVLFSGSRIFASFMDNVSGISHPYLSMSINNGKSFTAPVRLDNTGSPGAQQRGVTIASMPGGGIIAAWGDLRNGNWDIYSSIWSFKGAVVKSDFRVDDDTTGAVQEDARVASDPLGNMYASWSDQRDNLYAIRFAFMVSGNATFEPSIDVAKPTLNDGQRASSVIAPAPGQAFVVWQDDKADPKGTSDVFSSSASFPGLFGLSFRSGWNFVSIPTGNHSYRASTLGLRSGDVVSRWNETLQRYDRTYIVGVSPQAFDFALDPSTGYVIHVSVHERINLKGSVPIAKQSKEVAVPQRGGWAFVGFESLNITRYASDILGMLNSTGRVSTVARYDVTSRSFVSYIAGFPATDFELSPGEAYWCYCTSIGNLTYVP